jgi:hypothetical protein
MFERLAARAKRAAEARAARRRAALAEELAGDLPAGVTVDLAGENVRLSGRGLGRRFALDAAWRRLIAKKVR